MPASRVSSSTSPARSRSSTSPARTFRAPLSRARTAAREPDEGPCCVICLEPIAAQKVTLPCGCDAFHPKCIEAWHKSGHSTCPLCRKRSRRVAEFMDQRMPSMMSEAARRMNLPGVAQIDRFVLPVVIERLSPASRRIAERPELALPAERFLVNAEIDAHRCLMVADLLYVTSVQLQSELGVTPTEVLRFRRESKGAYACARSVRRTWAWMRRLVFRPLEYCMVILHFMSLPCLFSSFAGTLARALLAPVLVHVAACWVLGFAPRTARADWAVRSTAGVAGLSWKSSACQLLDAVNRAIDVEYLPHPTWRPWWHRLFGNFVSQRRGWAGGRWGR